MDTFCLYVYFIKNIYVYHHIHVQLYSVKIVFQNKLLNFIITTFGNSIIRNLAFPTPRLQSSFWFAYKYNKLSIY